MTHPLELTPANIAEIEMMSREQLIEFTKFCIPLGGAVAHLLDVANGMKLIDVINEGGFGDFDEAVLRLHRVWEDANMPDGYYEDAFDAAGPCRWAVN